MIDIDRQIEYWRDSAQEDLIVARQLINDGKIRHGLFFAHLALEKAIKAHVCRHTRDLAPRVHNLVRLLELSGLPTAEGQRNTLAEMNAFNIEGRYPGSLVPPPDRIEAMEYMKRAEEVFQWLMNQL